MATINIYEMADEFLTDTARTSIKMSATCTGTPHADSKFLEFLLNDATVFSIDSAGTVIKRPTGNAGSGNEVVYLSKMYAPVAGTSMSNCTAPFTTHLKGATFDGVWDPVMYWGYNADRIDNTQPCFRMCLEADYYHLSRHDFEWYIEYLSTDASVTQRPIFYYRERDGTVHGLQFTESNITYQPSEGGALYYYLNTGHNTNAYSTFIRDQSSVFQIVNGSVDSGARIRLCNTSVGGSYSASGGLEFFSAKSDTGAGLTHVNAITFATGATSLDRMSIAPNGDIWMFTSNDRGGTNYEGAKWSFASGAVTLAGATGGTGADDVSINLTPAGAGNVTATRFKTEAVTYAALPATPATGQEVNVSDAAVNTWGATISAGEGGYHVKARYNGTNWTVVGI